MGVEFSPLFINLIVIVVGLCFGSFATALAHRIPADQSVGIKDPKARSACPHCRHVLKVIDLVPLFSWLSTRGRCRYCGQGISASYPLTELCVLLACLITYWIKGLSPDLFFIIAAIPFFAALWLIDLRTMLLPNILMLILAGIGLARLLFKALIFKDTPDLDMILSYLIDVVIFAALAWALGFVMEKILKKEALGMGDVKFFALAGLWLGLSQLAAFCLLSGLFGILFMVIFRKKQGAGPFPFGPALIMALFVLLWTEGSLFM